jgi:hypothetical protein
MRKKSRRPFDPFTRLEAILVMKAAENRDGDYEVTVTNPMIVQHGSDVGPLGMPGPRTRVGTPAIVVRDPLAKDVSEVTLVQRNHPVQALAPYRANQSFAERVRLWRSHRRLEDCQTHRRDGAIDMLRVDAVIVMNEESMRLLA